MSAVDVELNTAQPIDYRYRPRFETWQSLICAKDSPDKTLVTGDGTLRYAPPGQRRYNGNDEWLYEIRFAFHEEEVKQPSQVQWDGELPIIVTRRRFASTIEVEMVAFQTPDTLDHNDFVRLTLVNDGIESVDVRFRVEMRWQPEDPEVRGHMAAPVRALFETKDPQPQGSGVVGADGKWFLVADTPPNSSLRASERVVLNYVVGVPASGRRTLWFCTPLSDGTDLMLNRVDPDEELARTVSWWRTFTESHTTIDLPEGEISRFYHTAVNGIYQLRERKYGYLHVQPGPSIYRGFWVLDGGFLIEALETAGHLDDAVDCFELLFQTQKANGMFLSTIFPYETGHWKETGVGIWAIWRHFQLTRDREWLEERYTAVRKAADWIHRLREISKDEYPRDYVGRDMVPEGFGDGGLGIGVDYTNIFWLAGGLTAAASIAETLGNRDDAITYWQEFESYWALVRDAMGRDFRWDDGGDAYLPTNLGSVSSATGGSSKLQGQWGFMHAIHPLHVLDADEPMVRATIETITRYEREDTCFGVGWIPDGIWTYAAGFWGNVLVKAGSYQHALKVFYSYINHASPTRCWREEQALVDNGNGRIVGDMPHGWAYAMFVLLLRNLLVFEDGPILRVGHGADPRWISSGNGLVVDDLPTEFGRLSLRYSPVNPDEGGGIDVSLQIKASGLAGEPESGCSDFPFPAKVEVFFPGRSEGTLVKVGGEESGLDDRGAIVIDQPGEEIDLRLEP